MDETKHDRSTSHRHEISLRVDVSMVCLRFSVQVERLWAKTNGRSTFMRTRARTGNTVFPVQVEGLWTESEHMAGLHVR